MRVHCLSEPWSGLSELSGLFKAQKAARAAGGKKRLDFLSFLPSANFGEPLFLALSNFHLQGSPLQSSRRASGNKVCSDHWDDIFACFEFPILSPRLHQILFTLVWACCTCCEQGACMRFKAAFTLELPFHTLIEISYFLLPNLFDYVLNHVFRAAVVSVGIC